MEGYKENGKEKRRHSIINALSGPDSADKWEKPSTSNFPPTFIGFRRDWGIGMPHAAANGEHDIVLIFSARSVRQVWSLSLSLSLAIF